MPEVAVRAARTRTIETKTTEEVPVEGRESQSLGKPWPEWLRERTPDQLTITEVMIYRREPPPGGFLEKLGGNSGVACEPIDENWIANRYGGGVYGVRIYSKDGKSSYEPALRITGEPKLSPREKAAQQQANPSSNGDSSAGRLVEVLERTIERLSSLQSQQNQPQGSSSKEILEAMNALESLRAKVNPPAPAPAAPKSPLEDINTILMLVEKLKPAPAPPSAFDEALKAMLIEQVKQPKKSVIEELKGLAELLPLIQGFGGGESRDWKTALIDKGLERIPDVIDGVGKIMDKRVTEANALAVRDQARVRGLEILRGQASAIPQPASSAAPAGAAPHNVQTSAQPAPPAEPAPWQPLKVVPIDGNAPAPAAAAVAPAEIISEQAAALAIDAFLKNRIVQLVAQQADPGMILDFIDGAAPQIGAMLSQATEADVRKFITQDPILAEIAALPHYEDFLGEFLEVLHEEPQTTRVQ